MEEHGRVVRVEGELALVEFIRTRQCAGCGLCRSLPGNKAVMLCRNPLGAVQGDEVRVDIGSAQLLKGSAVIYLLPLLSMFLGYSLGAPFSETAGVISSVAAPFIVYALVRWYGRRYGLALTSIITEVIDPRRAYP